MPVRRLIGTLRDDLRPDTERGRLVRSGLGTGMLKVGSTLIAFLASLLYARTLGPHGYGLYAYVMAWVAILTIPANMGLPAYLVREGAKAPESIDWLRRWADKIVVITGILAAVLLVGASFVPQVAGGRWLFVMAAPLPLITNLSSVRQALLQATSWIVRSQWPTLILGPAFTLAALTAIWIWRGQLKATELMTITVLAGLLPWGVNAMQLRLSGVNRWVTRASLVTLRASVPFMWLDGLYLINSRADLVLLGVFRGAHDAGVYAVAMRAAEFVPLFLTVANITIGPKVSRLYQDGEHAQLQRLATATARRVIAVTTVVGLVFFVGAKPIIDFFYGSNYSEGKAVLQILVAAQTGIMFAGPVGILLNMTAHANLSARAFGLAAGLNILLNLLLTPKFGMVGAASATAISIISCCALRWVMVRRHLGLHPSVIGL